MAVSILLAVFGHGLAPRVTLDSSGIASAQAAAAEPMLLPVALPDLSGMHPAVQRQLREAYGSLQSVDEAGEPASAARRTARSEAYGRLGQLLMAAAYLDMAERSFRDAQMLAPDDFRWPYYLGHVFISSGDLRKAAECFEQALRIRPDDFPALVWLGHVYIELGEPEKAGPVLTKARAIDPTGASAPYELGRANLAAGDYASAVQYLEEALRLNSGAAVIHYPLAMAYRGLGNLEKAQWNLDQTTDRGGPGATVTIPDPLMAEVSAALHSPEAVWELGRQAGARGDWPGAVAQFRNAIELAPDRADMRLGLAQALNRMGDARAALAELQTALSTDPTLATAHVMLGTLLERSGRDGEAIDEFSAAVGFDPDLSAGHLRLADALRRTGRLNEALASYRRVLELDSGNELARFGEAMALARLSRDAEARDRLRLAMSLRPEQPAFAQALARLLAASPDPQVRDGREALDLAQALAKDHKTTSVAETMAMALAEVGRFPEAIEWQRLAMSVALDAGHPEAARRMADNLALYQGRQPCRTPWREGNPEYTPGPDVEPGLLDPF